MLQSRETILLHSPLRCSSCLDRTLLLIPTYVSVHLRHTMFQQPSCRQPLDTSRGICSPNHHTSVAAVTQNSTRLPPRLTLGYQDKIMRATNANSKYNKVGSNTSFVGPTHAGASAAARPGNPPSAASATTAAPVARPLTVDAAELR